jgi:hypothetical protein
MRRFIAIYAVILNRNKEFAQLKWPMAVVSTIFGGMW